MSHAAKILRTVFVALAVVQLGVLGWLFLRRAGYPFDLEWMEGGMLCHSLRLLDGQSIYPPPSVDFVPFLYTPLYPAMVALLARVAGLGYALARFVSIASFVGALLLGYRFAARHGGSRAAAMAAMAIPAAAFAPTGAWYDLARPDSLWLLLVAAAVVTLYQAARNANGERRRDGRAHLLAALAGLLLVLAFFAKQTASPFMLALTLALVALNARLLPAFVGSMALFGLPALWLLNHASDGWFWTYIFRLHQGHAFYPRRAFLETPLALRAIVGPALLLVPWALWRRRSPVLVYAAFVALAAALASCLAAGTQWAITNAYIPGVYFISFAVALAAGRLVSSNANAVLPRLRPVLVYALLALALAFKLPARNGRGPEQTLALSQASTIDRFDPRRFVPTDADRTAGQALVERLRQTRGDVLIPFHPYYAHLAGKPTFVHQMGVMDVGQAGLPTPRGLAQAFQDQRFALVVLDDKIAGKWHWWPGLQQRYHDAGAVAGPRVYSGAMTVPKLLLAPTPPPSSPADTAATEPAIDHELQ